jgi:hypothetical protein
LLITWSKRVAGFQVPHVIAWTEHGRMLAREFTIAAVQSMKLV